MAKSSLLSSLFGNQHEDLAERFEERFEDRFEEKDVVASAAPTVDTEIEFESETQNVDGYDVLDTNIITNYEAEVERQVEVAVAEEPEVTMAAALPVELAPTETETDHERLSTEALHKRRSIHKIRSDLNYFQEQLSQNELFASKARDNLRIMAKFMQDTELELSTVDQLSRENKENTNRVLQLTEELEDVRLTLIEKNVELSAETNRVGEIREMLEESRSSNTELTERLNNAMNEIRSVNRVRTELENEHNAISIKLADVESENRVFGETIERQTREISGYLDSKSELEKTVEEQQKQQNRLHVQRDRMGAELLEKTESVRTMKEANLELRSSNEALRKELESKQRHATSKLKSREDEIFALKSEIDTLHSQLSVRKQMFNQAQNETNSARAIAKVAKDSVAEVEARLVSANLQREIEQKNLVAANNELAELSGRYKSLLKQLDRITQENESLRHLQQFYGEQADRAAHAALGGDASTPIRSSAAEGEDVIIPLKGNKH